MQTLAAQKVSDEDIDVSIRWEKTYISVIAINFR